MQRVDIAPQEGIVNNKDRHQQLIISLWKSKIEHNTDAEFFDVGECNW